MHKPFFSIMIVFASLMQFTSCTPAKVKVKIDINTSSPQINYGISKLMQLDSERGVAFVPTKPDYSIQASIDSLNYPKEAYEILVQDGSVTIIAGDETGSMYALLDIKDQLMLPGSRIISKKVEPALSFRALKFNLPWDSYRRGEALQLHDETCRDLDFWEAFLDMMAENRFNALTLWNLHPFNYLVRTEKYPEACGFTDEEMAEWKHFWTSLFSMAKIRGIETYLVNWNIFVSPEFSMAHNVSPISIESSLGLGDTSEIIKDYMREVVRNVIDAYPDLTGLGITLGEGMAGMNPTERDQWLHDSFIEGIRQASRKIKFIYRAPLSSGLGSGASTSIEVEKLTRQSLDTLTCFDGPINVELKFNWSHGHSTPALVKVHGGKLEDTYWNPLPTNHYLAWMIRNEDFFMLRWGQTDFIRAHLAKNIHPFVDGYYVGSETYIPAMDYITHLKGSSYNYAFERQWMFYKSWGHLLYNPQTPDSYFEQAFENRFRGHGKQLFDAQRKTSRIPLIIASFFNGWWDFTLYSEGMLGFNEGEAPSVKLLSLKTMIDREPLEPEYIGIKEFVADNKTLNPNGISPMELADSVDSFCAKAILDIQKINPGNNIDLQYELTDIKAWAYLGMYFSNKLRSAVAYQQFLESKNPANHSEAVKWLEIAVEKWSKLVDVTSSAYKPVPLMQYNFRRNDERLFHWSIVENEVMEELEWLKKFELH